MMEPPSKMQPVKRWRIWLNSFSFETGFDVQPVPLKENPDGKAGVPHLAGTHCLPMLPFPRGLVTSYTPTVVLLFFFLIFFNVYFWDSARDRSASSGRAERGRHRIRSGLQALSCQPRARHGAPTHEPWDHDLGWSWTLNWLSHSGAPGVTFHVTFFRRTVVKCLVLKNTLCPYHHHVRTFYEQTNLEKLEGRVFLFWFAQRHRMG